MTTYRIRIEGVNFGSFVLDTQDLSTIRGGGLALLSAPRWLEEAFPELTPVSLGASSGLFEAELDEAPKGEESAVAGLCARIRTFLAEHRQPYLRPHEDEGARSLQGSFPLGLATFVVDAVPASKSFVEDRERLLALNRYRQLRGPSLHLASPSDSSVIGVCNLDRVRPARQGRFAAPGEPVSEEVWQRRDFGRSQKQDFYQQETGETFEMGFSQSFEALADGRERGNLDAKMAVIYIDGNSFGSLQADLCTTPERQKIFDRFLRERRNGALRRILLEAAEDPGFRELEGAGPIRFETLLWGGDDLLWVVPAWRGLQVVARVFKDPESWRLPKELEAGERGLLTQATGLVFCHRGAPISRIRDLADELTREAKEDRSGNFVAYQVLESFDHTGDDLKAFRRSRTPAGLGPEALLLDAAKLGEVLSLAPGLQDRLPHRKVLELTRILLEDGAGRAFRELADQVKGDLDPGTRKQLDTLLGLLGGTAPEVGWLHLAELWDFLPRDPVPAGAEASS